MHGEPTTLAWGLSALCNVWVLLLVQLSLCPRSLEQAGAEWAEGGLHNSTLHGSKII